MEIKELVNWVKDNLCITVYGSSSGYVSVRLEVFDGDQWITVSEDSDYVGSNNEYV